LEKEINVKIEFLATKVSGHEEQIREIKKWENRKMGGEGYYLAILLLRDFT